MEGGLKKRRNVSPPDFGTKGRGSRHTTSVKLLRRNLNQEQHFSGQSGGGRGGGEKEKRAGCTPKERFWTRENIAIINLGGGKRQNLE